MRKLFLILLTLTSVPSAQAGIGELDAAFNAFREASAAGEDDRAVQHARTAWKESLEIPELLLPIRAVLAVNFSDTTLLGDSNEATIKEANAALQYMIKLISKERGAADASLASFYERLGHFEQPKTGSIDTGLKILKGAHGTNSIQVADYLLRVGQNLGQVPNDHRQKWINEAKTVYESLLKGAGGDVTDTTNQLAVANYTLGALQLQNNQLDDAAAVLLLALDGMKTDDSTGTQIATHTMLVRIREQQSRRDEATPHCLAVAQLRTFDPNRGPLYATALIYPKEAMAKKLTGEVTVNFTVDQRGFVKAEQVTGKGNKAFDEAALAAIRTWRYAPRMQDGAPVEVAMAKTFSFEPPVTTPRRKNQFSSRTTGSSGSEREDPFTPSMEDFGGGGGGKGGGK